MSSVTEWTLAQDAVVNVPVLQHVMVKQSFIHKAETSFMVTLN